MIGLSFGSAERNQITPRLWGLQDRAEGDGVPEQLAEPLVEERARPKEQLEVGQGQLRTAAHESVGFALV
jgi:hypothetical protein